MENRQDIAKQIVESDAYRIQTRIAFLYSTFRIFDANFLELRHLLEMFRDAEPEYPIWNIDRRYEIDAVGQETMRLLHNLLASAKTLVDLVRVLMSKYYEGTPFHKQYKNEIDTRFANDPLTQFVHGLRNYMLHYGLPVTTAKMEINASNSEGGLSITSRFVLNIEGLTDWDGWNGPATDYIAVQSSDLDILVFSEEYHTKIRSFHAWIQRQIGALHADEFEWLRKMQGRLDTDQE